MQALAEEWKKRDREREALVKKKVESTAYCTDTHNEYYYMIYCIVQNVIFLQIHGTLESESNEWKSF